MGHPLTPFCSAGSYAECDLWGRIQGFACNLKFERDKNFFNGGYVVLDRTLAAVCAVPADGAGTEKIKGFARRTPSVHRHQEPVKANP